MALVGWEDVDMLCSAGGDADEVGGTWANGSVVSADAVSQEGTAASAGCGASFSIVVAGTASVEGGGVVTVCPFFSASECPVLSHAGA